VGSGIPGWFNNKSTNSFGTIQVHTDLGSDKYRKGYALFIVYEFHEPHTHPRKRRKHKVDEQKGNLNSTTFDGDNPNFPYFVCQFQANGVDVGEPLVLCAPGVPSVGPNRFWVYIPGRWFKWYSLDRSGSVEASITTGSLNVEVKECGARVVYDENDARGLCSCLKSYENDLLSRLDQDWCPDLLVNGPIKSNVIGSANCQGSFEKKQKV
jgi:hypothetical protein